MKVVAIKEAFYNGRRVRVNAQLDVPEDTKGSWFVPVAGFAPPAAGKKEKVADTLSGLSKQVAKAPTDLA